jgi:hypothetical protein
VLPDRPKTLVHPRPRPTPPGPNTMSKIAKVEVFPIVMRTENSGWDADGSVDTVVVRITDDMGRTGIGESDAPPGVVKAFIEMPSANTGEGGPLRPGGAVLEFSS